VTIHFNWYAPSRELGILSVVPSYLGLRIYFNDMMTDDVELRNKDNYSIVGSDSVPTSEVHNSEVVGVVPEPDVNYPEYVDLECTDITHGREYTLTITPNKLLSWDARPLVSNNTAEYNGVSVLPRVQTVRSISATLIEVIFTKEMSPTADILDVATYSFDKGLRVREVTIVAPGVVHLLTTRQTSSEIYTLTVS